MNKRKNKNTRLKNYKLINQSINLEMRFEPVTSAKPKKCSTKNSRIRHANRIDNIFPGTRWNCLWDLLINLLQGKMMIRKRKYNMD